MKTKYLKILNLSLLIASISCGLFSCTSNGINLDGMIVVDDKGRKHIIEHFFGDNYRIRSEFKQINGKDTIVVFK